MWDTTKDVASFLANLAAIVTAIVAIWAWARFLWHAKRRRWRLESYLRHQRENSGDAGMRSVLHLMSNLAMTEEQIYSAAFASEKVTAVPLADDKGFAKDILFLYQMPIPGRYSPR